MIEKISIITVTYNSNQYIEDCISSVIVQTYKNIEHIIVDGGSTDGTIDVIKKNENNISRWVSEPDKGIYDAMNKGIKMATGDIIGILNSDDLLYDNTVIEQIANQFILTPSIDALFGDLVYVKKNDTNNVVRYWKSCQYFDNFFERGNVPPHPTLYMRSSVYKKYGYFNEYLKLAADYDLMFRMMKKCKIETLYIPHIIVRMRLGGATNKSIQNIASGNKEIIQSWILNGYKIPWYFFLFKIYKRGIQFLTR